MPPSGPNDIAVDIALDQLLVALESILDPIRTFISQPDSRTLSSSQEQFTDNISAGGDLLKELNSYDQKIISLLQHPTVLRYQAASSVIVKATELRLLHLRWKDLLIDYCKRHEPLGYTCPEAVRVLLDGPSVL